MTKMEQPNDIYCSLVWGYGVKQLRMFGVAFRCHWWTQTKIRHTCDAIAKHAPNLRQNVPQLHLLSPPFQVPWWFLGRVSQARETKFQSPFWRQLYFTTPISLSFLDFGNLESWEFRVGFCDRFRHGRGSRWCRFWSRRKFRFTALTGKNDPCGMIQNWSCGVSG